VYSGRFFHSRLKVFPSGADKIGVNIQAYSPDTLLSFGFESLSLSGLGNASARSLSLGRSAGQDQVADRGVDQTFAEEMVRRIQAGMPDSEGRDGSGLSASLVTSIDFVRENFGDRAATAVMGIMIKSVGEGQVSEQAFGQGMLQAVKFIDRNFGFAAGDTLIRKFNSDLNVEVNEYFDNGLNERIYAVTPGQSWASGLDAFVQGVAENFGSDDADMISSLLDQALKDSGGLVQGLRTGLEDAVAYLEEKYGINAATDPRLAALVQTAQDIIHPSVSDSASDSLIKGALIDQAV